MKALNRGSTHLTDSQIFALFGFQSHKLYAGLNIQQNLCKMATKIDKIRILMTN